FSAQPSGGYPPPPCARNCCKPERCTSAWPLSVAAPSIIVYRTRSADRKHQPDHPGNDLVGQKKEQARQDNQHENHDLRDQDLVAPRPGDLGVYLPDLLQKLDRVGTGHRRIYSLVFWCKTKGRAGVPHGWNVAI